MRITFTNSCTDEAVYRKSVIQSSVQFINKELTFWYAENESKYLRPVSVCWSIGSLLSVQKHEHKEKISMFILYWQNDKYETVNSKKFSIINNVNHQLVNPFQSLTGCMLHHHTDQFHALWNTASISSQLTYNNLSIYHYNYTEISCTNTQAKIIYYNSLNVNTFFIIKIIYKKKYAYRSCQTSTSVRISIKGNIIITLEKSIKWLDGTF